MAGEELQVIRLRTDFYRDGFSKVLIALGMTIVAIVLLSAISIYLHITKPSPVYFATDNEWRVLASVPVEQPYLKNAGVTQWVSETLPQAFTYDFLNYTSQLQNVSQYFSSNGLQKLTDLLNNYANYNMMQNRKLFITAVAAGAPFILNQGILSGRYAWWVQMPITINYNSPTGGSVQPLTIQVLVVRVPTLNNYYGVVIENLIVTQGQGNQVRANG